MATALAEETVLDTDQLTESAVRASNMLKALSNEYRLIILCHLMEGELQVAELHERLSLSQSSLSQHLSRLRHQGLVKTRRKSQAIYYSIAGEEPRRILEVLYELYCAPHKNNIRPL